MTDLAWISFGIALAANLPRIIWALRCKPDSPHYTCPAAFPLRPWLAPPALRACACRSPTCLPANSGESC